ncbi:RNA polymerase sigma-70 factor [Brevibacillus sp. B_LB10_24]|uniref:RNA polymerase sigma-70 factor n=1 Tax=Brevibacillus sp. B_LB10_24 TaxID=3380645 RepID=UPI0038BCAEE6
MEFETMYTQYRTMLMSIAYHMLGSLADAEDIVQEVFLEVQQQDTNRIENMKAYLAKAVTNRCINYTKSARKRREVYVGPWLPEPIVALSQEDPMELVMKDEVISYALLVALEQLNAVERAIFILREALDYSYREIAEILHKTEENCRKIHSRIKKKLHRDGAVSSSRSNSEEDLVNLFIDAAKTGNFNELIHRLTDDAAMVTDGGGKVRGALRPIIGRERILALLEGIAPRGYFAGDFLPVYVNGQRGVLLVTDGRPAKEIGFARDEKQDRITRIFVVANPDKLAHLQ